MNDLGILEPFSMGGRGGGSLSEKPPGSDLNHDSNEQHPGGGAVMRRVPNVSHRPCFDPCLILANSIEITRKDFGIIFGGGRAGLNH